MKKIKTNQKSTKVNASKLTLIKTRDIFFLLVICGLAVLIIFQTLSLITIKEKTDIKQSDLEDSNINTLTEEEINEYNEYNEYINRVMKENTK